MAISWAVIVILVIVGIFAIKLNHLRHRIFILLLILLALFLYVSVNYISVEHDLNLKSSEGVFSAIRIYSGWLANGFQNLKDLTGKIIKMDWTSTEGSFFEDKKR